MVKMGEKGFTNKLVKMGDIRRQTVMAKNKKEKNAKELVKEVMNVGNEPVVIPSEVQKAVAVLKNAAVNLAGTAALLKIPKALRRKVNRLAKRIEAFNL